MKTSHHPWLNALAAIGAVVLVSTAAVATPAGAAQLSAVGSAAAAGADASDYAAGALYVGGSFESILKLSGAGEKVLPSTDDIIGMAVDTSDDVDRRGTLYVVYASSLVKISPTGQTTSIVSGVDMGRGIAVAPDGTVFYSEANTGAVVKIAPDGTTSDFMRGLQGPIGGVAVLPDGYVLIATQNLVGRYVPEGALQDVVMWVKPTNGIAVDEAGQNVYVADGGQNRVVKVNLADLSQTVVGSGFTRPTDVSVDSAGNVYVADDDTTIVKVRPDGTDDFVFNRDGASVLTVGPPVLVDRVAGSDRFETSVEVSKAGFPDGAPVVFLASGTSFADALSAGPAAAKLGGPVLSTAPGALPASVLDEINRLGATKVVVVGGSTAVSDAVLAEVKHAVPDTVRVSGSDRFETSQEIASFAFGADADTAGVVTGLNFPDALALGAALGSSGPLLLVNGGAASLDSGTKNILTGLGPDKIWVGGGTAAVSAGIQTQLSAIASTDRLAGSDRFQTSQLVNEKFFSEADRVLLATGFNFPDALSGSAWAPTMNAPLFTSQTACVPQGVLAQINKLGATRVTLLGGTSVLTEQVKDLTPCS